MLRTVSPELREELRRVVGPRGWVIPENLPEYFSEPRRRANGCAAAVLRPDSTDAVANIVKLCARDRVGIVPWGGGTGLVGGQVATESPEPIVISLERLDRCGLVNEESGTLIAEAGCKLSAVRARAADAGWNFSLRIASEGSCTIGGNLATNAGGMNVLRHGNARDLCLGIEAVLADGSVWKDHRALRKDNTGYDLRNLLIGSEGTLGIITSAVLRLVPASVEQGTALAAVPDATQAAALAVQLRREANDILSAVELIDHTGVEFVARHYPDLRFPLGTPAPCYVMIEMEGGSDSRVGERLEASLVKASEAELVADAVIADSVGRQMAIRGIRETIPLANAREGAVATHDVAVPLDEIAALVAAVKEGVAEVDPRLRTNIFGHLGDGNLHANVFAPAGERAEAFRHLRPAVTARVFAEVRRLGGSVSAEHGVGRFLRREAVDTGSPERRRIMQAIKRALDPHGILNPGAVIDGGES